MVRSNLKNLFFFLLLAAAAPLFAQGGALPGGMQTLLESLLDIFTGDLVKTILGLCLCGAAIAFAYNKDNEQMKKKMLAIFIATAIIVGVQWIIGWVWTASRA